MHRMVESTVEGVVVPSSACVRGASYSAHRAHVVRGIGKRRKAPDCRFRKISGPRTFGAGRARLVCQPRCPTLYLAHNPHTPHAGAHRTGRVRMPAPRRSSFPLAREEGWVSLAATERTLRGAAADMSIHYFAAIPGVAALVRLQGALAWAEQHMKGSPHGCPFVGTSTHLYPKGSMGKMATKGGHDDNTGPAAATCWQNLGQVASQARLQLVVVVHGHDVVLEAPKGQMALFQAWLPHLTRNAPDGPKGAHSDWRVHHTAYARRDTEYFGWVACACREAGVGIVSHPIGEGSEDGGGD